MLFQLLLYLSLLRLTLGVNFEVDISEDSDKDAEGEEFSPKGNPTCLSGAREAQVTQFECTRYVDFVSVEDDSELGESELLATLGSISAAHLRRVYPPRPRPAHAMKNHNELPYPVPVGPSFYFSALLLVLLTFYLQRALHSALKKAGKRLELRPEIKEFPKLNLYRLQQSKRESSLRRESRNTWAWMAKTFLLMQKDPKVNVEVFRTTWSDFDLPKDVWGIVRAVLKLNAWFDKAKFKPSSKFNLNKWWALPKTAKTLHEVHKTKTQVKAPDEASSSKKDEVLPVLGKNNLTTPATLKPEASVEQQPQNSAEKVSSSSKIKKLIKASPETKNQKHVKTTKVSNQAAEPKKVSFEN